MKWMTRLSGRIKNQLSLFYTLFGSFILIIVLLLSVNTLSNSFFRNSLKEEIIVNSGLNLNTTVTNYEKHIRLIRSFMLGYLFDNNTQVLKGGNPLLHYDIVMKAQKDLQHTLNNPQLYLDNIIYYFKDSNFVIDKNGTRNAETMFSRFYVHPGYTRAFWDKEMDSSVSFNIYPSAVFHPVTPFEQQPLGDLMPILVKSAYDHNFAFIVLMNSRAIYEALHQLHPGNGLMIMDGNRRVLFANSDAVGLPAAFTGGPGSGYEKIKDNYYFYQTGAETGFTYVEVYSDKGLTAQIGRLNLIILTLLLLSLLISLNVSYTIAKRFHNPLARMLRSVQSFSTAGDSRSMSSRIKEFNVLHDTLNILFRSNRQFHEDLQSKDALLQQFAYMTRLKNIYGNNKQLLAPIDANRPYSMILFQIDFKDRFLMDIANSWQRALNLYKELIHAHFTSLQVNDSLTFQLEQDQILTLLFAREGGKPSAVPPDGLDELVRMLEMDADYFNFTIAPSPVCEHSADFAQTYQDMLDLVKQRRLGEGAQIIAESRPLPDLMIPSPSEESELTANLQAGADAVTIPLVDKLLDQLAKADASARQFRDFARDIVKKTLKIMYTQNISVQMIAEWGSPFDQLMGCHTLEQYKSFLYLFLAKSAAAIREKKSTTDATTKFVMDYVESHYGDDLSLDGIAGKLGITGPYLSTYFKEKTGTNFSDYIFSVRMSKTMEMLRNTDLKVWEIATLVGYYTATSLIRVFKRYTGMTPGQFRRKNQKW